ncbi:MAG: hypothetical protein HUU20_04010, partial [Pirellulales bacterium]|nr:hypothetical protein [Pirellulales bacterium]
IVAGCEDSTVVALDEKGSILRLGKISGRPVYAEVVHTAAGPIVAFATDKGEVKGFVPGG